MSAVVLCRCIKQLNKTDMKPISEWLIIFAERLQNNICILQ